jgi:hypothetical protein
MTAILKEIGLQYNKSWCAQCFEAILLQKSLDALLSDDVQQGEGRPSVEHASVSVSSKVGPLESAGHRIDTLSLDTKGSRSIGLM